MVKNGPTPTMFDMFMAVACNKPKLRCSSWGWVSEGMSWAIRTGWLGAKSNYGVFTFVILSAAKNLV